MHVALLTLFLGHFVALQSGFDADVRLMPGQQTNEIQLIDLGLDNQQGLQTERYNVALPFTITCTDIEQKLIDPNGSIEIQNTMDWRTQIRIDDPEYGTTVADVQLNKPFSYRGYRFFQASAITVGSARSMTLELAPENGGEPIRLNLARNGSAALPDGTKIDYEAFLPDFTLTNGQADTRSPDYNNPAVKLNVTTPAGEKKNAYAFFNKLPEGIPVGHGLTYSAHPVSAAVANATLDLYLEGGILANGQAAGRLFAKGLQGLADHPLVGDVRSRGMLAGVELVVDKAAKTKPDRSLRISERLAERGYANRLIFRAFADDIIGLAPPLCCTAEEIGLIIDRLRPTLDDLLEVPEIRAAVR